MDNIVSLFSSLKSIWGEQGNYYNNLNMLIYVSIGVIAITLLTHVITKKIPIIKYLPGLVILIIGILNFTSVINKITADGSLGNILIFIFASVSGLIGMLFALIIGITLKRPKRVKKAIKPDKEIYEEN